MHWTAYCSLPSCNAGRRRKNPRNICGYDLRFGENFNLKALIMVEPILYVEVSLFLFFLGPGVVSRRHLNRPISDHCGTPAQSIPSIFIPLFVIPPLGQGIFYLVVEALS